ADGGARKRDAFDRPRDAAPQRACQAAAAKLSCERPAGAPDVLGYHDAREIPNYWAYARQFVLQDHLFEPNASWSLPSHLFLVSGWSARCRSADPASCRNEIQDVEAVREPGAGQPYAWTDLT